MKPELRKYFTAKMAIESARDQFDRTLVAAEQALLAVIAKGDRGILKVRNDLPYHSEKGWSDTITGVTVDTRSTSPYTLVAVLKNGDNVPVDELDIGLRSDLILSVAMPRT